MKVNFAKFVVDQALTLSTKICFRDGHHDLDYSTLASRVVQMAGGLLQEGIKSGDHVIICMEDCIDWPVAFLGCIYVGVVPLPLSTALGEELFKSIAEFIDAKAVIAGERAPNFSHPDKILNRKTLQSFFIKPIVNISAKMHDPDEPAYMNVSSGSTGVPKIAVHRHQTLFEILKLSPHLSFSMTADSTILSIAKMSWNFGLQNSVTYALGLGATAIVIPEAPAAPVIFDFINRYNPTIVVTSPAIIRRLVSPAYSKYQLSSSIQHFHSSGEHLPMPLYDQFFERFGIRLNSCIGMMETCTNYAANPDFEHDPGTIGKPLPGCVVNLLDDQRRVIDNINTVGEIYVQSPAMALGYYKNQEKTAEVFQNTWVRTGDLAFYNANQNLVFVGRVDDVFKINDLTVSPLEIESEILRYPGVEQVAACGIDNNKGQKEIHVFVVSNDNFLLDQFHNFLKSHLFSHQMPRKIHLVKDLPQTVTYKNVRSKLQELVQINYDH